MRMRVGSKVPSFEAKPVFSKRAICSGSERPLRVGSARSFDSESLL